MIRIAIIQIFNYALVIVKPNAVKRGLIGKFLQRFENANLKIILMKMVHEDEHFWKDFYPSGKEYLTAMGIKIKKNNEERGINTMKQFGTIDPFKIGQIVKGWLIKLMASGPVAVFLLEGNDAARKARLICGETFPNDGLPGEIRFDYGTDTPDAANDDGRGLDNNIHCSNVKEKNGTKLATIHEIEKIFKKEVVFC
jgi:nucleoside-diphosphate kinase